jgi:RNA polymerase sigma factor (sigma-70 family)
VSAEKQRKRISDFLSKEWKRLVAYVHARLEDVEDEDAEDIVQDVVTRIFERADVTTPIVDLSSYIFGALRNRIIDAYRTRRRAVSLDDGGFPPVGESLLDVLGDARYEASAEWEKKAIQEALFSAIDGLSPDLRAVVVATELEGRKFRELSEEWNVPIGTLLARKHRAMRSLRAALDGEL